MRKKDISKKVLKITEGIFSSLVDLALWSIFYFYEVSPLGHPTQLRKAEFLATKSLEGFNYLTLKRAIYRARSKGWIKEDLTLTKEGKERLEGFIPIYFGKRKWDGNWYLVSYDILERRRTIRNILRDNLKRLGFGKVHASLWISPFNFLGEVEKIIKDYRLSPFVILAISNQVGREESKYLANRIWKLEEINEKYRILIEKTKNENPEDLIFEYFAILNKDPQLPSELLPEEWLGEEAYLIFKNYLLHFEK
jgi:phenylacetic acid degradation operon negative regulatory protein